MDRLPRRADGRVWFRPPEGESKWRPVPLWEDRHWHCWLGQIGWAPECVEQYLQHDRYEFGFGLLPDGTLANHVTAHEDGVKWLYLPNPRAVTLHTTIIPNTLWAGAAGSSKSFSARWEAIKCCFKHEDFRALMVRRELEELRRSHLDKLEREVKRLNEVLGKGAVGLRQSPFPCLTVERMGSKIVMGGCQNSGDEEKYLSEDYDLFIPDEGSRLLPKQIVGMAGRLRNDPKLNRIARMIITTNPGGPAHDYCVSHFITKLVSLIDNPRYQPEHYTYIPARLYDNQYYADNDGTFSTYEDRLFAYEPARRKQLLDGDWNSIVDQFFTNYDPAVHVRSVA